MECKLHDISWLAFACPYNNCRVMVGCVVDWEAIFLIAIALVFARDLPHSEARMVFQQ